MTRPSILTIILNYRTPAMTLRSVAAALKAVEGLPGEILVIDNHSGDESFRVISDHVTSHGWGENNRVRVLQSGHNGGFGAGNNFGIRAGLSDGNKPDYVYVLNSDAFPAPDAVKLLLNHLETHPGAGFAGSYIHGTDGDPHLTTFRFPSILSELEGSLSFGPVSRLLSDHAVPVPIPAETCRVDWLAGASILMRQKVLDEIGLFDETFFLYFEETDLCRRAFLAGHQTHFVRNSEVAHVGSASTGMKTWKRVPSYWFDSRIYYFTKNHSGFYAAAATLIHLTGGGLNNLRRLISRRPRSEPPAFLRGMASHGISKLFHSLFSSNRRADARAPITGD